MLWWCIGAAWAADGYWHPDDVAAASTRFTAASERLGVPFEALQTQIDGYATGLQTYREALDLLGARAPAAERDRLEVLEVSFNRQHAAVQGYVDTLVTGFDEAFVAAKDRATAGLSLVECASEIPDGRPMPGMRPRTKANPECVGTNFNAVIAAKIDADPVLAAQIDALLGPAMPTVTLDVAPQSVIGTGERWISVGSFFRTVARDPLSNLDARDDEARTALEALLEQGVTGEQLAAAQVEGEKIALATAKARATFAEPVWEAADRNLAKWAKQAPPVGWCANPRVLGGCVGEDATVEGLERLKVDAKVLAATR